jgi:hypothetical protein
VTAITATSAVDLNPEDGAVVPAAELPVDTTLSGSESALAEDGAIDPRRLRLFRGPHGVLRCTVEGDKSVLRAKVVRLFPLSERDRWVNILDGQNKSVCLIEDPRLLDETSRRLVDEELAAHYCLATITRVHRIKNEYRTMYCDVETDRGPRDFVLKWATDTILWLGPRELLLVDIDTNRFHIPDVTRLDARSRKELEAIA